MLNLPPLHIIRFSLFQQVLNWETCKASNSWLLPWGRCSNKCQILSNSQFEGIWVLNVGFAYSIRSFSLMFINDPAPPPFYQELHSNFTTNWQFLWVVYCINSSKISVCLPDDQNGLWLVGLVAFCWCLQAKSSDSVRFFFSALQLWL